MYYTYIYMYMYMHLYMYVDLIHVPLSTMKGFICVATR